MTADTLVLIRWRGKNSVSEAVQLIQENHNLEITLAPNYHNALFHHLYPDADSDTPNFIDLEGGSKLLKQIADVDGLEEIASLITSVDRANSSVTVKSPTPRIYIGLNIPRKDLGYY